MDSNVNGLMFQLGNIMRIDNGFVEESVCFNTAGGYIVVSYNAKKGEQPSFPLQHP